MRRVSQSRLTFLCALLLCFLLAGTAPAQTNDSEEVKAAIAKGTENLKRLQASKFAFAAGGAINSNESEDSLGATALIGLTLVECDVPASDDIVQRTAQKIRDASVTMTHTYTLSLAILFLDRLGDAADVPLIESMTVRLLAGQGSDGGWSYSCPSISESEVRRLTAVLRGRSELVGRKELPKTASGGKRGVRDLPEEIQKQLDTISKLQPFGNENAYGDNSNTQFATLALWVGRRHGIPVEKALARVEARFRASQDRTGGWAYTSGGVMGASPAMTCAGLLGLAVGHGIASEAKAPRDIARDPVIHAGLLALGSCIDHPNAKKKMPTPIPVISPANRNGRAYYFLWSLERVAMAYGLKTIGDKDWYAWGAEILLANQQADGGWQCDYEAGVDTCFALLFLRRANLAQDLTATLRGKKEDPGKATLRGGGVGGAAAAQAGEKLRPALGATPKAETDQSRRAQAAKNKSAPSPVARNDRKVDPEVARLSAELVDAPPAGREKAIAKLRDSKGGVYTEALADAIVKLSGESKSKAREALAERLTRMTSEVLADKLADEDAEIRRAAALACAMKEDKAHLDKLIDLLNDREKTVTRAAYAALKSLTGKDFGPSADAGIEGRAKAIFAWKAWVKQHADK